VSAGPLRALAGALLLTALAAAPLAAAEKDKDPGAFFFGFNGAAGGFRGDFDGGLTLWHFDKSFAVPTLSGDFSLGLSFGRKSRTGLWEVVYLQATKNGLWLGRDLGVTLSLLEVRGRAWVLPRSPVRPFMFLGFGFPRLRIQDGARMGGSADDASYYGGHLVLGGGILAELGPRLFLSAGAGYRALWFLYAFGGGKGRDISKLTPGDAGTAFGRPLKASRLGLELSFGVTL
jgi:hypothetical protein